MNNQNLEAYNPPWESLLTNLINQDRPALAAIVGATPQTSQTLAQQAHAAFTSQNIPVVAPNEPVHQQLTASVITLDNPNETVLTETEDNLRTARKHRRCIILILSGEAGLSAVEHPGIAPFFEPGRNLLIEQPPDEKVLMHLQTTNGTQNRRGSNPGNGSLDSPPTSQEHILP